MCSLGDNMVKIFSKNKKASHVSFAIAFLLFVGFVIFFFGMINSLGKTETSKKFILEGLQNKIIENSSSNLTIISVNESCVDNNLDLTNFTISEENGIYKIYSSDNLPFHLSEDCGGSYGIGLNKKEKVVFSDSILRLTQEYTSNYRELKERWNVPSSNDFSFSFYYENGTEIKAIKDSSVPTEVFAKNIALKYFDGNSIKLGRLKVTLW